MSFLLEYKPLGDDYEFWVLYPLCLLQCPTHICLIKIELK